MENKNDEKEIHIRSPGKNTFLTSLSRSTSLSFSRLLSSPVLLSWKVTFGPFRGVRDTVWVVTIRIQLFLSNSLFLLHVFSPLIWVLHELLGIPSPFVLLLVFLLLPLTLLAFLFCLCGMFCPFINFLPFIRVQLCPPVWSWLKDSTSGTA